MDIVGMLILVGGSILIGILTWLHLIMIAAHHLIVQFGWEIVEDYINRLEQNDDVSYA